jgi:hypothetical protein
MFQDDNRRWLVWASYQYPEGWALPAWGLFVYDPVSIRLRVDGRIESPDGDQGAMAPRAANRLTSLMQ